MGGAPALPVGADPRARLLRARAGAGQAVPARRFQTRIDPPDPWLRRAGPDAAARWSVRGLIWDPTTSGGPADGRRRRIPVVLVHGLVVAARMCAPTARRLAADGLVLAPDLPGCGRSSKPLPVPTVAELGAAVAVWLRALRPGPVVVVGVSVGSQVAVHAALAAPESVAGLVLASPTVDRRRRCWLQQLWRWQVEQATQSLRLRAIQVADYAHAGVPRALRTFASTLRDRPERLLARVEVPVLVCFGTRDPLLTRGWAREVADAAPRGRLAVLPGVVHAMSHDNPLELARVVNGFVDELGG